MTDDEFVDNVVVIIIDDILKETETRIGDRDWWIEQVRHQFGDEIKGALREHEASGMTREEYLDLIRINHTFS